MHAKCGKCTSQQDGYYLDNQPMLTPSSTQLARSSFFFCNKVDSWCVTVYWEPATWLVVLTPRPVLSLYTLMLSSSTKVGRQTWKCLKSDCTVPLWDPSPESSTPRGSQALLSLDSGTVYPFVPSETFWAEDEECPQVEVECSCSLFSVCHQYPHLSVVLVTWPTAPVPGSVPTGQ